jgi:hypothetical protein
MKLTAEFDQHGVLQFHERYRLERYGLRHKGQFFKVELLPDKRRSTKANSRLWGYLYGEIQAWCVEMGDPQTREQIHKQMKGMFLCNQTVSKIGVVSTEIAESRKLSRFEFYEFMQSIESWMWDFCGIVLRDKLPPEEDIMSDYDELQQPA